MRLPSFQIRQQNAMIISIGLLFCFIFSLLIALHAWYQDWQLTQIKVVPPLLTSKNDMAALITAIPEVHLFGQTINNAQVPVSSLQLKVTGIVSTDDNKGAGSKVYISAEGQPGKIYKTGEIVSHGVKVYEISKNTVILENNGKLEKLPLVREKLQFKSRPASPQ